MKTRKPNNAKKQSRASEQERRLQQRMARRLRAARQHYMAAWEYLVRKQDFQGAANIRPWKDLLTKLRDENEKSPSATRRQKPHERRQNERVSNNRSQHA
jgi:hypothetical protein